MPDPMSPKKSVPKLGPTPGLRLEAQRFRAAEMLLHSS